MRRNNSCIHRSGCQGAIGVVTLSLCACNGTQRGSKSEFTQAEVVAGHASYHAYCSGCHRDDLQGGGLQGGSDATPLTGVTFKNDWSKYSIQVLYRFVSKAMPEGLEGNLSPNTYSNIISFVLAANGAKAGQAAFNPNSNTKIGDIANGQTVMAVIKAPTGGIQSSASEAGP
jgi:cytochrome c